MRRHSNTPVYPRTPAGASRGSAAAFPRWVGTLCVVAATVVAGCDDDVHRPADPADASVNDNAPETSADVSAADTLTTEVTDTASPDATAEPGLDAPTSDGSADGTVDDDVAGLPDTAVDTTPDSPVDTTPDSPADTTSTPDDGLDDTSPDGDVITDDMGPETVADTGPDVPAGKVPVMIAVGHVGRTIMTCDDGLSWVNNRSYDTEGDGHVCGSSAPVTCFQDGITCDYWNQDDGVCQDNSTENWCDCDHHPGSGTGIAYGDGHFVTSFGWGPKGSLRRSSGGQTLTVVEEGSTYTGVTFGQGRFIAGSRYPKYSDDGGATWQAGTPLDLTSASGATIWNARQLAYVDVQGGRWVITGQDGDNVDVQVSDDNGETWAKPTTLPGACGTQARGIAGGNGRIVIVHGGGEVCTSSDGGVTFSLHNVGGNIGTTVVYDGTLFLAWTNNTRYSSPDGETWTTTPLNNNVNVGAVGYNPVTGTLVAVRGGWTQWYDKQRFYRSTDGGLSWDEVPDGSYIGSHPLREMTFGWADAGACGN